MTVSAIVTLGYHGGVKYIATLGYTTEQLSYAVVDTFLPQKIKAKKEIEEARLLKELREIEREIEESYIPLKALPPNLINYEALARIALAERDEEEAILLLM